ncbi:STAS domain-containing protein [Mycobacterium sp. B14F4]|uniref:STAS domain-containing protein n=1 Tax=Mycobacterium sp. B14F4 TaxID=3153565 RepID=UPI00325CDFB3
MQIDFETVDAATVLRPRGVLDSSTYRSLRDRMIKAALDEPKAVVVDITALSVPAESALAVFTSARWHVNVWPEVPIVLVCAHPAGRSAIARNSGSSYVPVYATVDAALAHSDDTPRLRRRARAELTATVPSLQRARELVLDWLTAWHRPEMIPTAKVVVTTLVENVLQHTGSHPELRLEYNGATVTIAVNDENHAPAGLREYAPKAGPSGLQILAALCRAWGNAPTPSGKTVWAVIGPENVLR